MKVITVICILLISNAASALEKKPAKSIEHKDGKATSSRVEAGPAVKKDVGCISVTAATSKMSPPELYKGVTDCIKAEKFENASDLFALAGMYASFDAARVSDKSAGQAKAALIKSTFDAMSEENKRKFSSVLTERLRNNKTAVRDLCSHVQKIGYPTYYPDYMVSRGSTTAPGTPVKGALSENFDPAATWNRLFESYLHCPPASAADTQQK